LAGRDLSVSEATWAMRRVMEGEVTDAQLGGFLLALRAKGEAVEEIIGFRDAILEAAVPLPVDPNVLDIVGTGGDCFGTVNISSLASSAIASTGIPVAKHGNRAARSKSVSSTSWPYSASSWVWPRTGSPSCSRRSSSPSPGP